MSDDRKVLVVTVKHCNADSQSIRLAQMGIGATTLYEQVLPDTHFSVSDFAKMLNHEDYILREGEK